MTHLSSKTTSNTPLRARLAFAGLVSTLFVAGCEHDSFMNPSVTGRWEATPTTAPVLRHLACIEGPSAPGSDPGIGYGERNQIVPEDLIPEVDAYRIGPGDNVDVTVQDAVELNQFIKFERQVDPRGYIELPQVGSVRIDNQTPNEIVQSVGKAYIDRGLLKRPVVDVNIVARRKLTYTIIGGVTAPGTFAIPRPEYRLLEAISQGGRYGDTVQWVYVIRGTALTDAAQGKYTPPGATPAQPTPGPTPTPPPLPDGKGKPQPLIDLIDQLGKPEDNKPPAAPTTPKGSPGMFQPPAETPPTAPTPVPAIDIDSVSKASTTTAQPSTPDAGTPSSRWQFVNGQWVSTTGGANSAQPGNAASALLSQRVLQIPLRALLDGQPQYNVVIRPGDIIRFPAPNEGIVYVSGSVQRPGVYQLPTTGEMTLLRAVIAASGLSDVGIPERVELIRYLGDGRQACVRLNLRAIHEFTQPDVYLRDGDVVNVGTNFWATPLAIVRNGFRANYGFGFTLDRNFGYDIFGPQRTNSPF